MMNGKRTAAYAFALAFGISACGGGSSATPPAGTGTGHTPQTIRLTLAIPGANAAPAHHARKPFYVSRATQGIGIDYGADPQNFATDPNDHPAFASSVLAGSAGCSAAAADGSFNCTFNIPGVPEGYDDFRVTLWDGTPSSGQFSGLPLSTNVIPNQAVLAGRNNVFAFSLLPVINDAILSVSPASLVSGTASSAKVYIVAKDPSGNTILGNDQFVTFQGDPVTLSLASSDSAHANVSPSSFSNAAAGIATITYDGTPESSAVTYTGDSDTSSVAFEQNPVSLAFTTTGGGVGVPGVPQVAMSSPLPYPASYAASGADGSIWVTTYMPGQFMRIVPGLEPFLSSYSGSIAGCADFTTAGPDGAIWYGDTCNNAVGKFVPGDTISATETANGSVHQPTGIIAGPDNKIWIGSYADNTLDSIDPVTMAVTQHAIPDASAGIYNLAAGPPIGPSHDPSVCYTGIDSQTIYCYDITTDTTIDLPKSSAGPAPLVTGPDNLLYVGMQGTNKIVSYSAASGSLQQQFTYPASGSLAYAPGWLTVGPDHNIWFVTDSVSGINGDFGRISVGASGKAGVLREYGANSGSGLPSNAYPSQILVGPDNNLYFTDFNLQTLDRINL